MEGREGRRVRDGKGRKKKRKFSWFIDWVVHWGLYSAEFRAVVLKPIMPPLRSKCVVL